MIIGSILNGLYLFFNGLIGLLPDAGTGIPTSFIDALELIIGYANAWNWLLPISEMFAIVVFVLGTEVIILSAKLALYIIRLVRGA